jgi:branched-chain amino acid transport system permease protein
MCVTHNFWGYFIPGLANGFLYALIALGYTLVYGVLQLINFAHSEVFMSGGFGGLFVVNALVGHSKTPSGLESVGYVIAGVAAGAVAGAVIAFILERVAYRPLRRRHAPKLAFLISAIGMSYFLLNLAGKEFGRDSRSIDQVFSSTPSKPLFSVRGAGVTVYDAVIAVAAVALMLALDALVNRTRLGQGIRAVAQDADTAGLMGVDINRVISQTFIVGGLLGGAAGFLFGLGTAGVSYTMGFVPGVKAFTAAVLGGIGNIRGAMLGGLVLGVIEGLSEPCVGANWIDVVSFFILVLVLLVRPTGLLGERLGRSA